ncbi:MAG: hypothetical protein V2A54_13260 [Bacteroidota bacterium]
MAAKKENQEQPGKSKGKGVRILNELATPGLIILGVIGGSVVGKLIDKVAKVDETATEFQWNKIIKPVVQLSVGVGGAILLKNKNLKLIASGVAVSGVASSVKVFLKKDLLNGLGSFNIADPLKRVFREPINLSIAPYDPELPALPAQTETVQVEMPSDIMGDLDDYQEVQEVQIL